MSRGKPHLSALAEAVDSEPCPNRLFGISGMSPLHSAQHPASSATSLRYEIFRGTGNAVLVRTPIYSRERAPPKLSYGGGEAVIHSSVVAFQGFITAFSPFFILLKKFQKKRSWAAAVANAATVMNRCNVAPARRHIFERRKFRVTPREARPTIPIKCIGMKMQ